MFLLKLPSATYCMFLGFWYHLLSNQLWDCIIVMVYENLPDSQMLKDSYQTIFTTFIKHHVITIEQLIIEVISFCFIFVRSIIFSQLCYAY